LGEYGKSPPFTACTCAEPACPIRHTKNNAGWRAFENAQSGAWDLDPRLETTPDLPARSARLGFPRVHVADSISFWRCRVHPDDLAPHQSQPAGRGGQRRIGMKTRGEVG
jgi:hypothetical protein